MHKVTMSAMDMHGFDKAEDVWQLKWPLAIHLVSNWKLTSLGCEVSHNNKPDGFSLLENPMQPL